MLYRGQFLALDDDGIRELRAQRGDPRRRAYLDELEERIDDAQGTDKAWYILFNCFQNSSNKTRRNGLDAEDLDALNLLFLGGKKLHKADHYVINWIPRVSVPRVTEAMERVSSACLKERYRNVNRGWFHPADYDGTQEQCSYVLRWFQAIRAFFVRHRGGQRHIVFSSQYQ